MALPRPVLALPEMTSGSARCPAVRDAEAKSLWLGPPDDALAARAGATSLAREDAVAARRSAPERDMVTPLPTWAAEHARVMRGRPEGPGRPRAPRLRGHRRFSKGWRRTAPTGEEDHRRARTPDDRTNERRATARVCSASRAHVRDARVGVASVEALWPDRGRERRRVDIGSIAG